MRIALIIAMVLGLAATLWCAAGYFFAPAQAHETQAELRVFLDRPVSADVPAIHSGRVLRHGRNIGIAAILTGAATAFMFTAFILSGRRRPHDHTTA
jgi:hypothetical protein